MPRRPPFTEAEAREAIARARSWAEAARLLGYRPVGGNPETVKRHARRWGISTDHFNPRAAILEALDRGRHKGGRRIPLEDILVEGCNYSRYALKRRLFAEGLKDRRCEMCGQDEIWHGRRMALVLDHINGIANDNRLENLRIVCSNCAATLDTHCGRNLPRVRVCVGCGRQFEPRNVRHRYCTLECFNGLRKRTRGRPSPVSTFGVAQRNRRKIERPPYEPLIREVMQTGYAATGRRYGVSDNAVRKWLRQYERERAIAAGLDPDAIEIPRRTWPNHRHKHAA
jgi:hypothetical protein